MHEGLSIQYKVTRLGYLMIAQILFYLINSTFQNLLLIPYVQNQLISRYSNNGKPTKFFDIYQKFQAAPSAAVTLLIVMLILIMVMGSSRQMMQDTKCALTVAYVIEKFPAIWSAFMVAKEKRLIMPPLRRGSKRSARTRRRIGQPYTPSALDVVVHSQKSHCISSTFTISAQKIRIGCMLNCQYS